MAFDSCPYRRTRLLLVTVLGLGLAAAPGWSKGKPDDVGRGPGNGNGPTNGNGGGSPGEHRGPDAALVCASTKHVAAGRFCAAVLTAEALFERGGSASKRDAALGRATKKLQADWAKAERKAERAGTDCAATFLTAASAVTLVDSASGALVGEVGDGLDPDRHDHDRCAARIVQAAGHECRALLKAESNYQRLRSVPGALDRRAKKIAEAKQRFSDAFDKATAVDCPTTATAAGIDARVDAIASRIVRDTLASPEAGDGDYVGIAAGPTSYKGRFFTPVCLNGTPYRFWARRGTVNKLVVYYQGGGACWDQLTCNVPTCDVDVRDSDDPGRVHSGFADLANPANPFRDWSAVFVSYCSCDIHFGDAAQDYGNVDPANPRHVEHRGYQNAQVVEKWAREHFLAPEEVFVTGSSAGAYGAWFNGPLLHDVWPSAHFNVLADAGNGVVTQEFLETYFPNWNFEANLPSEFPQLREVLDNGSGIPGYTEVVTSLFPDTNWAHYSSAFDGGAGGQTGFYNLMLNGNNPVAALTWWEGSCAFRNAMQSQAVATAATVDATTGNYRYYIGSGSRHTMWGASKVYSDTTGGVPTLVDWVGAMLASGPGHPAPGWTNVEADPYNIVLPGDPVPTPTLLPPFVMSGSQILVECPAP